MAEHFIFDGATPAWTVLWAAADGLAGGAAVSLRATLRVQDEPVATLFVMADRERIDRLQPPQTDRATGMSPSRNRRSSS